MTRAAILFALGRCDEYQLVEGDSLLLGKADRSPGRRPEIVIRDGLGGAGDFHLDVGLLGDHAAYTGGQAARATKGLDRSALAEVFGDEMFFENGLQLRRGAREHAGWDFFGADFKEQFHTSGDYRGGRSRLRMLHRCFLLKGGAHAAASAEQRQIGNVGAPTFFGTACSRRVIPDRVPGARNPFRIKRGEIPGCAGKDGERG